jgi:quinol monooxygenase YgiN
MYGLIGKMRSAPGKREELLDILFAATGALPGCLSYIVARDPADTTALWVTEVWTDAASHKASLALPEVQAAITRAKPIIAGFEFQIETEPAGGFGLPKP